MATDLATLAIKVENGDVVKATTSLNTMAVAGGKTEAATQRLTRRMALLEIEARQLDADLQRGGKAMVALEIEARKMDAELNQSARAMALLEIEARKMDAELARSQRAMHLVELEARKMDAAMTAARSSTIYNTRAMALQHEQALKMNAAMGSSQTTIAGLTGLVTRLAAAFAAYKVAQFATDTLNLAARYETLGVAMDAVGRNAGVTGGRMAGLQADLQKTGISAIEARVNLTRLVQAHVDLSKASTLARVAQDAAVIGNLNSSDAFATLVHGIQSAQTDVLRTIGINVNFEQSYARIAAQLHTTVASLTEEQKTQARANAVMAAGRDIAGTYEAAMGTVGKQLTSTTRYLEDMRVKVGTAFLPEYAAAVKSYADALKLIADNSPAVIGAITGITAAVAGLILVVKGSAIVSGIAAIGGAIAAIGASPIIVGTAALATLATVVGSFAADAALARRETAEFSETLKHLPDAALIRNFNQTALAVAYLNDEIARGGKPTEDEAKRLADLTGRLAQFRAQLDANARAHAVADAPKPEVSTDLNFGKTLADREAELTKITALNGAYRSSAVALSILGIQIDATDKKRQDAIGHIASERAALNANTDATAKARIQQVLLNDQLEREAKLRSVRAENADALRAANENVILSGQDAPTAERTRNRFNELNRLQDAERKYHDDTRRATAQQRADAKVAYDETVAQIHKVADLNDDAITRARKTATAISVGIDVRDTDAQTAGIRAMMVAELEGRRAVEQMSIQLAGEDAVRRAVNDATARGTELTDEQADALRRSAEELEKTRINAAKLQAVFREVSGAANQFFTDVFNKKNPAPALAQRVKAEVIGALSDAVARPLTIKIAKILGIEIPLSKQEKAAKDMNIAADKQLRAAQIMAGGAPGAGSADGTIADASTVFNSTGPAWRKQWEKAMGVAGAGLGGYGTGYGIGQATGSGVLGAIGGAAAGAKLGAAFGPPGVVVGALAGFAGGIIGAGDAAREAAARLEEARRVFKNTWDGIIADINGDELAKAIIGANDRFQDARQKYLDAHLPDLLHGGTIEEFAKGYEDIAKVQAEYIDMLRQEAAAKARSQIASYRERELRAQGKTAEADALHAKEERQQLVDSFGKEIDATERSILASYDAAAAAEKNAAAVNALTSTIVRGGPSGFKLNGYIQQYATGLPHPAMPQSTLPWPTLPAPLSPLAPPKFYEGASSTGKVATGSVTVEKVEVTLNVSGVQDPVAIGKLGAKAFLAELDKTVAASGGLNTTRAVAINKMTVS